MNPEIRIIIADDHPIFRQGLKAVIELDSNLSIVAEAEDGDSALARIEEFQPQVVILDIDMPGKDGFEVARMIKSNSLRVEIIFLTMHKDETHFNEAINLGVKGFVIKDSAAADIVNCIKAVAAGQSYISPTLSSFLLNRRNRSRAFEDSAATINDLTPTERRVLLLLAEYKTSKEIAGELGVSPRTIENHRANICIKLKLEGTHALVKFAAQNKSEISSILSS